MIPILVDQTDVPGTQVIMAGIRVAQRILPLAFACYQYDKIPQSQNVLENSLLLWIAACLPAACKPVFVMDRSYARASLLQQLRRLNIPFLIRGRRNTMVRVDAKRLSLGRLPHRVGRPQRYTNATYQDSAQEPVDIIVFHDPRFREPWFRLVPAGSQAQLPTADVLALYRQRRHIELTFRDWKTHLGLRGLRLEADPPLRLGRLLLALSSGYILAVCSAPVKWRRGSAPIAKFSAPSPDMEPSGVSALSPSAYSPFPWHASPIAYAQSLTTSWLLSNAGSPLWRFHDDPLSVSLYCPGFFLIQGGGLLQR